MSENIQQWESLPLRLLVKPGRPITYGVVQTGEHIETGVPCVRVVDLTNDNLSPDNMIKTTYKINQAYRRTILAPNDLMLALRGEIGFVAKVVPQLVGANITRGVALISPNEDLILADYLLQALRSNIVRREIRYRVNGSALKEIPIEGLRKVPVLFPPLPEQRKIADILSTWDRAIDLTTQLITVKQQYKRGLMQQLLMGKKRFPKFCERWQAIKIGDFLSESRINGSDGRTARKITVKLYGKGVVPKEERNTGSEATKYYQRRAGQFIYSKLDCLNGAFGIIPSEMDRYESTLDLPCFDFNGIVHPQFFLYFVSRECFYSKFAAVALGGRKARRIQVEEFLASEIEMPKLAEQERIVAFLSNCDHELALLNRKLELLKKQKQGLMQQLLTGKIRVKT